MLTAETITDREIEALRNEVAPFALVCPRSERTAEDLAIINVCDYALTPYPEYADKRAAARARCAAILNERAVKCEPTRLDDESTHWIRPCDVALAAKADKDRGWRLHVKHIDDEGYVEVCEEQVFPERLLRADANHIRAEHGHIRMNLDEATWLRARLDEVIPILARQLGHTPPQTDEEK